MPAKKVWHHCQESTEDEPDSFTFVRTCVSCLATDQTRTEEEVREEAFSDPMRHKIKRAGKNTAALAECREEHGAAGQGASGALC